MWHVWETKRNGYRFLVCEPTGQGLPARSGHRWNNIKIDLK